MPNQSVTIRGGVNVAHPDPTNEPKKPRGRPPKTATTSEPQTTEPETENK